MSGALGLLRIETRRSVAVWFVPLMVGVGWYISGDALVNGLKLWGELRSQLGFAMVVIVPIAGAVAAWVAGREGRRGLGEALRAVPAPAFSRDLAGWGAALYWCVAAYLGVAVARSIETALDTTWGAPDIFGIGIGVAAIGAAAAFGYAIGALVPSRFAAVLAAGALALGENQHDRVLALWDSEDSSLGYLSPWVYVYNGDELGVMQPKHGVALMLWLGGIAAVMLAVVAVRRSRSQGSWLALASAVVVATVGAFAAVWFGPRDVGWAVAVTPACTEAAITLCVHPAYEEFLNDTAAVVGAVAAPVAGLPGVPTRVTDYWIERGAATDDAIRINHVYDRGTSQNARELALGLVEGGETIAPGVDRATLPNPAQFAVAHWLVEAAGYTAGPIDRWTEERSPCWTREPWSPSGPEAEPPEPREVPGCQAAVRGAVERFAQVPDAEKRAWLERNFADLRAGSVTVEELP